MIEKRFGSYLKILLVCLALPSVYVTYSTPLGKAADPPAITSLDNYHGFEGALIRINGTGFTGATVVTFGGTAASSFTVNSDTQITATIGTGSSGVVSVTTADGTAMHNGFNFIEDGFFVSSNIENDITCFGVSDTDPFVCSGNGQCVAPDGCQCSALSQGTLCQIPIRWGDGTTTVSSSFDFSSRLFIGSELSDPNAVYSIAIKINEQTLLQQSRGTSIGLIQTPSPDTSHDVGFLSREWGYLNNGQKFSQNLAQAFGDPYGVGDTILMKFDYSNETLSFYLKKAGETDFVLQGGGPAFSGVSVESSSKGLSLALSVTCFGSCNYQIVEP